MDEGMRPAKSAFTRVGMRMDGVLYTPDDESAAKHVAVLVMHSDADYLLFPAGPELARRGYRTLCANVSRQQTLLDQKLLDVRQGVEYLRALPGVKRVVLLGHSGGATLMSAYQAVAENGAQYFQGPEKIVPMRDIGPLPPADGVILLDSNWGNGAMTLLSLDPAVTEEGSAAKLDASFDAFDPANGFSPEGARYADAFVRRYQRAQGERNNRLIDAALARLAVIERREGSYLDDEPFVIVGGNQIAPNNKLFPQDLRLFAHTKAAWPLLHADGSVTHEVVRSVRRARGGRSFTGTLDMGALITTVRQFLSANAVRTTADFGYDETGVNGVDWDSCYCCTPGNTRGIAAPTLIMGMTGGYEYLAAELIYENAKSADRSIAFVEGATHMLTPAKESERFPGQFGDTVKTVFDHAAKWLGDGERF